MDVGIPNEGASLWMAALWRASWQGGLALAAVWLLCRALPRLRPTWRCWLWRLAVAKLLISVIWAGPVKIAVLPARMLPVGLPSVVGAPSDPDPTSVTMAAGQPPELAAPAARRDAVPSLALWLLLAWGAGVAWQAARLVGAHRRARDLVRACGPADEPLLTEEAARLCGALRLGRRPRLLVSPDGQGPLGLGIRSPAVVLPAWAAAADLLPEARLLLAHELAHVKRRDLAWGWLMHLAQALFFFHPLLWPARREWHLSHEAACDEMALAATGAPAPAYGRALLRVAELASSSDRLPLAATGAVHSFRLLRQRLQMLQAPAPVRPRHAILAAALLVAVGVPVLVPVRLVAKPAAPPHVSGQRITIRGTVTDTHGKPVAGATVRVFDLRPGVPEPIATGQTDRAGRYTVSDVGPVRAYFPAAVVVRRDGYGVAGQLLHIARLRGPQGAVRVDLRLLPAAAFSGQVTDLGGKPVAGATVAVRQIGIYSGSARLIPPAMLSSRLTARTGADGRFSIGGLPKGTPLLVDVTAAGYARSLPWMVTSPGEASLAAGGPPARIVLERAGEIVGRAIVAAMGKPAPGVAITAESEPKRGRLGRNVASATAGSDGRYRLTGVAPGTWRVGLGRKGTQAPEWVAEPVDGVTVTPGKATTAADLRLSKGSLVTVQVRDTGRGDPIEGVYVTYVRRGTGTEALRRQFQATNEAGEATFRVLPGPGVVELPGQTRRTWYVPGGGSQHPTRPVEVAAGENPRVTIEVSRGAVVEGVVVDPRGNAVAGADVYVARGNEVRTDGAGRFSIPGVVPDVPARVWAREAGVGLGVSGAFRPALAAPAHKDVTLQPGTAGPLTGRVLWSDGRPAAGLLLSLLQVQPNGDEVSLTILMGGEAVTDAEGRYRFTGLPAGRRYRVAYRSGGGAQTPLVTAPAGRETRLADLKLAR